MSQHSWLSHVSLFLFAVAAICISTTFVASQGQPPTSDVGPSAAAKAAPKAPTKASLVLPVRTDSPRQTLKTLERLTGELEVAVLAYRRSRNRLNFERIQILEPQFMATLDLSKVPRASRWETGIDTSMMLLDIFGRVTLPPLGEVPDVDAFDDAKTAVWRVPGTPIKIVRIDDGPREGEFLFSARTVGIAPIFYRRIAHLPLRSAIGIESWHEDILQISGPMIPINLVSALPDNLTDIWLDTPIWKIVAVLLLMLFAVGLLLLWHKGLRRFKPKNKAARLFRRSLTPLAIIVVVLVLNAFVADQINITGAFATIVGSAFAVVIYVAAVLAFWLLLLMIFEWIILSPQIPDKSLNANLLRLVARIVGFLGTVLLLAVAGEDLGLPVFSILAGLGIGGLAVALAIRPTLENLISGMILYIDRPVKVGDYCSFGDQAGIVEQIGMRATRIRTLDRTLVSVPNSVLADKEINNSAHRDRMLIRTMIGLRYETAPDQLRYVLAKLREMFHAHPRIHPDTIRVRFVGYGASSLDVEIRVYALTRERNDFYAIREDVLLRANDIVRESGSGFAFPSQTIYVGRDEGLDDERGKAAIEKVQAWRKAGNLPFPRLPASKINQVMGTIDYPPRGSPDAILARDQKSESADPLSAEPSDEDRDDQMKSVERERR